MKEIEYKFLLEKLPVDIVNCDDKCKIEQIYFDKFKNEDLLDMLNISQIIKTKINTLRLRIEHHNNKLKFVLNAKTEGKKERLEFEKTIDGNTAKNILKRKNLGKIDKIRHKIAYKSYIFEFDEYLNKNQGLFICEVEVNNNTDNYNLIASILTNHFNVKFVDVTNDLKFKNNNLCKEMNYENNK